MPFRFARCELPEVILLEPKVFEDGRGFFMETYKYSEFAANGIRETFLQMNHSRSAKNILRGLHFQRSPKAQGKLVRVLAGNIFDVAVDIRLGSPSYGKWCGLVLSADNKKMVYVPRGFAHGFCVVSEEAEVLYLATEEYAPELEGGILWNDPDLNIPWPTQDPILSQRDRNWPSLRKLANVFA